MEDQPLFQGLRAMLRSGQPLDLLSFVSSLVAATDRRNRDPFQSTDEQPGLDLLVESLIGVSFAETTAALMVIRAIADDDDEIVAQIDRELANRRQPMPEWLRGLAGVEFSDEVWKMTHVLGDSEDFFLGVTLPSGQVLAAVLLVDHNMGSVVKDAFVVEASLSELLERIGSIKEQDHSLVPADPKNARSILEEAIERGALIYPPIQSDTWPMARPLVEWMLRLLPGGGVVPARPEWSETDLAELADDFFDSRCGKALDHADERGLLASVLWFGTDYGPGDPLRWSPVSVEILLADWVPRKIVARTSYLAKLPRLLRSFIRYAHEERGVRVGLTSQTLAAVDDWEPEYQRLIRSERPQGAEALASLMLPDYPDLDGDEDVSIPEIMLASLSRAVGGRSQLMNLDVEPLPDEPFEWAGIPDDVRPRVQEYLDLCDRCADELFDVEHRTAMRRFLSRAAVADSAIFRRRASPVRGAAAVAWVICRANDSAGYYPAPLTAQDLLAWFEVKGSVSQRAEAFLRANGVNPFDQYGSMNLEAPDLLTSQRRRTLIEQRDRWLQALDDE